MCGHLPHHRLPIHLASLHRPRLATRSPTIAVVKDNVIVRVSFTPN